MIRRTQHCSFPFHGARKAPAWLETGRVLSVFESSTDRRGSRACASYLEARAKDREAALNGAPPNVPPDHPLNIGTLEVIHN